LAGIFIEVVKEFISVRAIMKSRIAGISSGHDMIEAMGEINTFVPRHDIFLLSKQNDRHNINDI